MGGLGLTQVDVYNANRTPPQPSLCLAEVHVVRRLGGPEDAAEPLHEGGLRRGGGLGGRPGGVWGLGAAVTIPPKTRMCFVDPAGRVIPQTTDHSSPGVFQSTLGGAVQLEKGADWTL